MPYTLAVLSRFLYKIRLNYAALFMRPVLFASLALLYQVRLDKKSRDNTG